MPSFNKLTKIPAAAVLLCVLIAAAGRQIWLPYYRLLTKQQTVEDVQTRLGTRVEKRIRKDFKHAETGAAPKKMVLVAYKAEKELELWVLNGSSYEKIKTYAILASSGNPGPKLREGDKQIPEGIYSVEQLNPNSTFYLSMKLNYPNAFDRAMAKADHRDNPGSDIFIHGKNTSVGCLAIGDTAIEELFILTAKTGMKNVKVIIAPNRAVDAVITPDPPWRKKLYSDIKKSINAVRTIHRTQR